MLHLSKPHKKSAGVGIVEILEEGEKPGREEIATLTSHAEIYDFMFMVEILDKRLKH